MSESYTPTLAPTKPPAAEVNGQLVIALTTVLIHAIFGADLQHKIQLLHL